MPDLWDALDRAQVVPAAPDMWRSPYVAGGNKWDLTPGPQRVRVGIDALGTGRTVQLEQLPLSYYAAQARLAQQPVQPMTRQDAQLQLWHALFEQSLPLTRRTQVWDNPPTSESPTDPWRAPATGDERMAREYSSLRPVQGFGSVDYPLQSVSYSGGPTYDYLGSRYADFDPTKFSKVGD